MSIIDLTLIMINNAPLSPKKELLPLFDEFLLHLQTDNYSNETLQNYERDLLTLSFFLDSEIKKTFDKKAISHIELFKAYLMSKDRKTSLTLQDTTIKLSSGSANRILSSFRSYLKFLIFQDHPVPIPPEKIKMMRMEKKHYRVAELSELINLIESPTHLEKDPVVASRNRAMLEVLFATGMRISELLSLNRTDINSSGKVFIMGKGQKERLIYLTPRALKFINKYLSLRMDESNALFAPQKGRRRNQKDPRISTNYLQERIKRYREKLGIIVPTSAHSLRHGFATYMAEEGASPVAIQMLLGHASLNTTTRYVNASDRFAEDSHKKYHPLANDNKDE